MIGALQGVLTEKGPQRLLIEVQGVGYEVEVPMSTFLVLPPRCYTGLSPTMSARCSVPCCG